MENYFHAVEHGMLKVFAKMGISTLASYKGAQIFEALGLNAAVVAKCFKGTASRVEGVGFDQLAADAIQLHGMGFPKRAEGGKGGARRRARCATLASIIGAARRTASRQSGTSTTRRRSSTSRPPRAIIRPAEYRKYANITDALNEGCNLRGMLRFKSDRANPSPSTRWSPRRILSSGFAPALCRTAPSPWRRTPRWRAR